MKKLLLLALLLFTSSLFADIPAQRLLHYDTPIDTGSTYTSDWLLVESFPSFTVKVNADQSGILQIDFSSDCKTETNDLDYEFGSFTEVHRVTVTSKCARVYISNNSGSNQTSLDVSVMAGNQAQLAAPINSAAALDSDATIVRPTSYQDEVRRGLRTGVTGWTKFGYRSGLTAAAGAETVWETTGNYTPPSTASTMTITYDGTGGGTTDGSGTTGATELTISYIDENGLPQTLTHTLETDGSDITTVQTLGINRVAVSASGTADTNNAAITITATTGGAKLAIVPASQSVTQQAIYHVGSNHDAVSKFLYLHINKPSGGNAKVTILGYIYNRAVDTTYEIFKTVLDTSVEVTNIIDEPIGFNLSPTDVLYFTADTDTNNAEVVIRFSLNEYQRD